MKKVLLLLTIFSICLSACASRSSKNAIPDVTYIPGLTDGSFSYTLPDGAISYSMHTIPFDMEIDGKIVPAKKVSFFEEYADHGYTAFVIITLGRENLTDDDIYWITKYDDNKNFPELDVNLYVNSEKNKLSHERLHQLGSVYDKRNLYYVFHTGDRSRYSFLGSEFRVQIMYSPTSVTASDSVYYHYTYTVTEANHHDSSAGLSPGEFQAYEYAVKNS